MEGPKLPEEYDDIEIDDYFENLYAAETVNSPLYCLWKGQLYENIKASTHVSDVDAMHVSRMLSNGEVEEAEDEVYDLLEEEEF